MRDPNCANVSQKNNYISVARRSSSIFAQQDGEGTVRAFDTAVHALLSALAFSRAPVSFVQVGTNDADRGDRLVRHVAKGGWHGILIEPQAQALNAARERYIGLDGLIFEQCAVWPDDDPPQFWEVRGESVLSSFSRETIELHSGKYDDLAAMIAPMEVRTARLDDLCAAHAIWPDLVAVDTEGTDDIVLSTLDLENLRPALVLFEHVMLSRERSRDLANRLKSLGYRLLHDRHDCLAVMPDRFDGSLLEKCETKIAATRP
jgi:FkbM family methyltransferase